MNRAQIFAILFSLLCFADTARAGDPWIVGEDGVGPVKIGMTLSQLTATLHQKLTEEESGNESCYYVNARGHDHIHFMIIDDHLVRIDVEGPRILTASGLQVGDSESKARKIYGPKMKVTEHKYNDAGHYLTVQSDDRRYGIRFETDQGKITMFYVGTYEAIQYVEGCL
jgi:hypothetical protein